MPTSQNPVYYGIPFQNRTLALNHFLSYTEWSIGKFFTVLYHKDGVQDNVTDVRALVAVGIKNASECGPMGTYDPDAWENKYYPSGAKGPEFFTIIADSGADDTSGGGTSVDLNNTVINLNGQAHSVANQNGEDEIIDDPFAFHQMSYGSSMEPAGGGSGDGESSELYHTTVETPNGSYEVLNDSGDETIPNSLGFGSLNPSEKV